MHEEMPPVLVVYGALRSGTTLLRLMLDGHSRLTCPGEADFLGDFLSGEAGQFRMNHKELLENRIFKASGVVCDPRLPAEEAVRSMARQMQNGKGMLVIMVHRNLAKLLHIFPDARILHVLRDPRDVARSSIGMGWAGNTFFGVDHWIRTEDEWDRTAETSKGFSSKVLRYENLLRNPRKELEGLCGFVGLDYEEEMLSYPRRTTYDLPDLSLIEQWKTRQSETEIALVEGKIGSRLESKGYRKSGLKPRVPGPIQRWGLAFENRKSIWLRKFRKFGIIDPLLVGMARRLHRPDLARGAQRRIDVVTIGQLK